MIPIRRRTSSAGPGVTVRVPGPPGGPGGLAGAAFRLQWQIAAESWQAPRQPSLSLGITIASTVTGGAATVTHARLMPGMGPASDL